MKLNFFKMSAQGNDYIYFDLIKNPLEGAIDYQVLARKISLRRFAIGADGIVLILPSEKYDARMRIFNADGSEAAMCGSALRCVSFYLSQKNKKNKLLIETNSGLKSGFVSNNNVTVNLGDAKLLQKNPLEIHEALAKKKVITSLVEKIYIGNQHVVIWVEELDNSVYEIAQFIEQNYVSNGGINIHFAKIINETKIRILTWERGSGKTFACGTGAGASAFSAIRNYNLKKTLSVVQSGGEVSVSIKDEGIFLTGKVTYIFEGNFDYEDIRYF